MINGNRGVWQSLGNPTRAQQRPQQFRARWSCTQNCDTVSWMWELSPPGTLGHFFPLQSLLPLLPQDRVSHTEGNREKTFSTGQMGWGISVRVLAENKWHSEGLFKGFFNEKIYLYIFTKVQVRTSNSRKPLPSLKLKQHREKMVFPETS